MGQLLKSESYRIATNTILSRSIPTFFFFFQKLKSSYRVVVTSEDTPLTRPSVSERLSVHTTLKWSSANILSTNDYVLLTEKYFNRNNFFKT